MSKTEQGPVLERVGKRGSRTTKVTLLGVMACILSVGSLVWTTYSLLDFFQVGGIDLAHVSLSELNLVALSIAGTADLVWTLTMVAQYRGTQLWAQIPWAGKVDILPWIGWVEVLFVAALLAKHGSTLGNGAAGFAAALPILTKLSWMMALADLKDPTDLTPESKEHIAAIRRKALEKRAEIEAYSEAHAAEMEQKRRESEAKLADEALQDQLRRQQAQHAFDMRKLKLEQENQLKGLEGRLRADLMRGQLQMRQEIDAMQDENDFLSLLRRPPTVRGQIVPQAGPRQLTPSGMESNLDTEEEPTPEYQGAVPIMAHLRGQGLADGKLDRAAMAYGYYTAEVEARLLRGAPLTKKEYCEAKRIKHPSRLTEATQEFEREWFAERGLATWMTTQN